MPIDLRGRLIALAEDLSSSSRLMADVGDAAELQALWREIDVDPTLVARSNMEIVAGHAGRIEAGLYEGHRHAPGGRSHRQARPEETLIPVVAPGKSVVIECKLADGPKNQPPLEVSEADEILYAKYGGTQVFRKCEVVLTAPRDQGEWVNWMPGRKKALSVHGTKAEAEARGREIARERHGKHVIYQRDGLNYRSRSYA
jgi:hypothetical protein